MGTLGGGIKTAAKWGTAITGAAVATGTVITGMAVKFGDTAGAIDDTSKKVGISAEEYQKWAYAAKLGGMESATLENAMIKQQKAFSDAKDGSKSMSEAYQKLGIDITQIGTAGESFNVVMAKLADMKDETQRNALANDIFGKSYAELSPLLAEGSEGMKNMKDEAVKMGGVLSNETVSAGAEFGDTIDKLKTAGMGLFNNIASSVLPIVQKLMDAIIDNMPMIQGVIAQVAPIISNLFSQLMPPLMELAQNLFPIIINLITTLMPTVMEIMTNVLPIVTQLLNMLLPPLIEIVSALLPPLMEIINALLPILSVVITLLEPILNLFTSLLEPIVTLISTCIAPLITILASLITSVLEPLQPILKALANIFGAVLGGAISQVTTIIKTIMDVFKGLITFITGVFTGDWGKAWDGVKAIFSSVFEGLISIAKSPINFIIGAINTMLGGLNKLKIPDWVPGIGGKGFNIPLIPKLAKGGLAYADTLAMVGDNADAKINPEVIAPLSSLSGILAESLTGLANNIANSIISALGGNSFGGNNAPVTIIIKTEMGEIAKIITPFVSQELELNASNLAFARG